MVKPSCLIGVFVIVAGCSQSSQQREGLTVDQASGRAVALANSKAKEVYDREPFAADHPARVERGRWVWFARQGYGQGDIEVTVELALDGSTNHVDLELLDNRAIERFERGR